MLTEFIVIYFLTQILAGTNLFSRKKGQRTEFSWIRADPEQAGPDGFA
jgi:hypothetical protein